MTAVRSNHLYIAEGALKGDISLAQLLDAKGFKHTDRAVAAVAFMLIHPDVFFDSQNPTEFTLIPKVMDAYREVLGRHVTSVRSASSYLGLDKVPIGKQNGQLTPPAKLIELAGRFSPASPAVAAWMKAVKKRSTRVAMRCSRTNDPQAKVDPHTTVTFTHGICSVPLPESVSHLGATHPQLQEPAFAGLVLTLVKMWHTDATAAAAAIAALPPDQQKDMIAFLEVVSKSKVWPTVTITKA